MTLSLLMGRFLPICFRGERRPGGSVHSGGEHYILKVEQGDYYPDAELAAAIWASFDAQLVRFDTTCSELDTYLASHQLVPTWLRAMAGENHHDVVTSCQWLKDLQWQYSVLSNQSFAAMLGLSPDGLVKLFQLPPDQRVQKFKTLLPQLQTETERVLRFFQTTMQPGNYLRVIYKHVFFPVRAFQDTLYKMNLELFGVKAGRGKSMAEVLKVQRTGHGNNVAMELVSDCPDYLAWFERWRDLRTSVKEGVNFSISGGEDPGMTFGRVKANGGMSVDLAGDAIRVSQITQALSFSADLASRTLRAGRQAAGELG